MSTVSRPHTQQRKVSRRRRVIRRFVALIAVAFVSATVFEGVVLWTHKAFAAPWTSAAAFAEEETCDAASGSCPTARDEL